jgi:hypothetical protein
MAFFSNSNPIALFLALVVVVLLLRMILGKHKRFQGGNASYITPVLIIIAVVLVAYRPLLEMLSFGLPFLALLLIFLFIIAGMYFVMGFQKAGLVGFLKQNSILKIIVQIAIICIIIFAGSTVFGQKILEDPSVSIVDSFETSKEPVEVDFSPLFTKSAIGMITLIVVMGLAFVFINLMR